MGQMISKDAKSRLSAAEFMKKYRGALNTTYSLWVMESILYQSGVQVT